MGGAQSWFRHHHERGMVDDRLGDQISGPRALFMSERAWTMSRERSKTVTVHHQFFKEKTPWNKVTVYRVTSCPAHSCSEYAKIIAILFSFISIECTPRMDDNIVN